MLSSLASAFLLAVLPLAVAPGVAADPSADQGPPPAAAAGLDRVSPATPGPFPPPRSFEASYRITWADIEAAHVEIRCASDEEKNTLRTTVKTATVGGGRLLYKSDGLGIAVADRRTLRPVRLDQTEERNGKRNVSHLVFGPAGAVRTLEGSPPDAKSPAHAGEPPRPRRFDYPGIMDIHSALLEVRSLPLAAGDERRFIVMSATTPYLATIKVVGRERVKVKAGEFPAIKCSISLQKVNKHGELEPYKSLKEAFAWISDDNDRVALKVETQIFIGSVNLEMEKITFPPPAAPGH